MSKKKKKQYKKKLRQHSLLCLFLVILVLTFTYILNKQVNKAPQLDELTTSYISFNNNNATDRLTINNLEILSERIGKSKWNKSRVVIPITGEEKQDYEIILYPLHTDTKEEYIELYIQHKKEKIRKKLSELENSSDGGKILYQGKIDHSNVKVNMWISNKYKDKKDQNSFEIKIKAR